eukprot:TRINITY_DN4543_c0_g1_i1.p1 TRINITY_DN4543_c0_g1~~TRINITY_DN4543_c0_g1_i1.p1  ORF type:complete len:532 (+),score=129.91 TRINITY_DN4543_c0_g1_i1:291-1886(+)
MSATNSIKIDERECAIKKVTVYNDRAEVTRDIPATLPSEGEFDIVVEGLSQNIDKESIHVGGGKGKATIIEVSYDDSIKYEGVNLNPSKEAEKKSQIEELNALLDQLTGEEKRIAKESQWLEGRAKKLMDFTGEKTEKDKSDPFSNESLKNIENFLEFYHRMQSQIDERSAKVAKEIKEIKKKKDVLEQELRKVPSSSTSTNVTVTLRAPEKGQIVLELSYVIKNCNWTPSYDFRVDSSTGRTQVLYYGVIKNFSGENWRDAFFSLSTASPLLGGSPPSLTTCHVSFFDNVVHATRSLQWNSNARNHMLDFQTQFTNDNPIYSREGGEESLNAPPTVNTLTATATSTMSSTSFNIQRKSTIESDNKPHKVTIGVIDLIARFTYTFVPKLTPHAYIKASLTNTSTLPFLSGPASIFMDLNFVTKSSIKDVNPQEKFALYLGVDMGIKSEYKPVRVQKSVFAQGLFRTGIESETVKRETVVKNMKDKEVAVVVVDQLPLSSQEKIKSSGINAEYGGGFSGRVRECTVRSKHTQ